MQQDNNMHFTAKNKEDINYYLKSIATINNIYFEDIEDRFGIDVIRCSRRQMNDERFNQVVNQISRTRAKIDYYNDDIGGIRITLS